MFLIHQQDSPALPAWPDKACDPPGNESVRRGWAVNELLYSGHTCADGHRYLIVIKDKTLLMHSFENSLDELSYIAVLYSAEDNNEFFPAEAGNHIHGACLADQNVGKALQDIIPAEVSDGVVNL